MIVLEGSKNRLVCRETELLTTGSVNVNTVQYIFHDPDNEWDGMTWYGVFRIGKIIREVPLDENMQCQLPWEVLSKVYKICEGGFYGIRDDQRLPTIWVDMGPVIEGVVQNSDLTVPPILGNVGEGEGGVSTAVIKDLVESILDGRKYISEDAAKALIAEAVGQIELGEFATKDDVRIFVQNAIESIEIPDTGVTMEEVNQAIVTALNELEIPTTGVTMDEVNTAIRDAIDELETGNRIELVNGFGEVYSDEERVVGLYFGKPLYERTWMLTAPSNSTTMYAQLPELVSTDVEYAMIKYCDCYTGTDGWCCVPQNSSSVNYSSEKGFIFWTNNSGFYNKPVRLTLLYTKVADSQNENVAFQNTFATMDMVKSYISGVSGVANVYSEEEQVVGICTLNDVTKTVYRKMFPVGPIVSQLTVVIPASAGVDMIFKLNGFITAPLLPTVGSIKYDQFVALTDASSILRNHETKEWVLWANSTGAANSWKNGTGWVTVTYTKE